jgi:hypothetical protein
MATFNAIWINGGKFNSVDLDFFASKQIFNLYLQVAAIDSNGIHLYPYGPSPQETAANIDWVHSYDSRMRVLDWTGCRPELYGHCDITTVAQRTKIVQSEAAHVQECHFDGLASDLETGDTNPGYNTPQNLVDFFNEETVAMRNLGKISAPFIYAGQKLWYGNFDKWAAYFPQINVDYAVITLDRPSSGLYGAQCQLPDCSDVKYRYNEQMGYIETLHRWLQGCPSKLAPATGYRGTSSMTKKAGLQYDIEWVKEYIATYGDNPKLAGFSLYDYKADVSGTPPENQYTTIDSPISAVDWADWDAWAWKNVVEQPPAGINFKFAKSYQGGNINLTLG